MWLAGIVFFLRVYRAAVTDYQYYALKAVEMDELAQRATSEATKHEFERLAHEYRRLADSAWPGSKRA